VAFPVMSATSLCEIEDWIADYAYQIVFYDKLSYTAKSWHLKKSQRKNLLFTL